MALEEYQEKLIESALSVNALKFGAFELKSGRISPYFFLASELNTGSLINSLASAYAQHIASSLKSGALPAFDVIFGPAYKGIPLAATVALVLWRDYQIDLGWAYDRKETKDHGEGGILVGAAVASKRVLILDDVITSGKAIRIGLSNVAAGGGKIVGAMVCLDREESGPVMGESAVAQVSKDIGGPVTALLTMSNLMAWLEIKGRNDDLSRMKEYQAKYGVRR
ncbi:orotate phosphoribosyltransferase [Hysterangium stoloniferum]|nr:orotate phosphoribosyltransferase [Hysterangium stoloniferum]